MQVFFAAWRSVAGGLREVAGGRRPRRQNHMSRALSRLSLLAKSSRVSPLVPLKATKALTLPTREREAKTGSGNVTVTPQRDSERLRASLFSACVGVVMCQRGMCSEELYSRFVNTFCRRQISMGWRGRFFPVKCQCRDSPCLSGGGRGSHLWRASYDSPKPLYRGRDAWTYFSQFSPHAACGSSFLSPRGQKSETRSVPAGRGSEDSSSSREKSWSFAGRQHAAAIDVRSVTARRRAVCVCVAGRGESVAERSARERRRATRACQGLEKTHDRVREKRGTRGGEGSGEEGTREGCRRSGVLRRCTRGTIGFAADRIQESVQERPRRR